MGEKRVWRDFDAVFLALITFLRLQLNNDTLTGIVFELVFSLCG